MEFNVEYFKEALMMAIQYAPVTVKLTLLTFVSSLIIGTVVATIRVYRIPVLSQLSAIFVTIYMGLPLMVALVLYNLIFMTCYADVAAFLHLKKAIADIDPIVVGYFAMILSTSCSVSETVRGAFRGIENVQFEAGYSIGLTKIQTLRRIILPQMVPIMIPGLINLLIGTVKASNLVSAIGVTEVMVGALIPCGRTYSYLEGYLAAALVYWVIGFVIEQAAHILEKRSSKFRRRPA